MNHWQKTYEGFLWSPTTGVSDPSRLIKAIADEASDLGGEILYGSKLNIDPNQKLSINDKPITTAHFVNAAGSQSDRIAHKFNLGLDYSMIPFMGVYRAVEEAKLPYNVWFTPCHIP